MFHMKLDVMFHFRKGKLRESNPFGDEGVAWQNFSLLLMYTQFLLKRKGNHMI